MTRLVDVTVGLGGVIESRRVHDTADWPAESVALLEAVRPIVRAGEWVGPLAGVLDVPRGCCRGWRGTARVRMRRSCARRAKGCR